jgi:hypothetical protein
MTFFILRPFLILTDEIFSRAEFRVVGSPGKSKCGGSQLKLFLLLLLSLTITKLTNFRGFKDTNVSHLLVLFLFCRGPVAVAPVTPSLNSVLILSNDGIMFYIVNYVKLAAVV